MIWRTRRGRVNTETQRDKKSSCDRGADEFVDVLQLIEAPAKVDKAIHLGSRQQRYCLIAELVFELSVAQGPMNVSQRLLDEARLDVPIRQLDLDARLVFRNRTVSDCLHKFTNAPDGRIIRSLVRKFPKAPFSSNQTDGGSMVDGVLAVQSLGNLAFIAQVQNEGRDVHTDSFYGLKRR